jgi:hypothetical protein
MGFDREGRRRGACLKSAPLFLINALLGHYRTRRCKTCPTCGALAGFRCVDHTGQIVAYHLDHVPMEERDTNGDLYEYMLGKIATAGQNGQFRTPRHIIRLMVERVQPKPIDVVCDPACGYLWLPGGDRRVSPSAASRPFRR